MASFFLRLAFRRESIERCRLVLAITGPAQAIHIAVPLGINLAHPQHCPVRRRPTEGATPAASGHRFLDTPLLGWRKMVREVHHRTPRRHAATAVSHNAIAFCARSAASSIQAVISSFVSK